MSQAVENASPSAPGNHPGRWTAAHAVLEELIFREIQQWEQRKTEAARWAAGGLFTAATLTYFLIGQIAGLVVVDQSVVAPLTIAEALMLSFLPLAFYAAMAGTWAALSPLSSSYFRRYLTLSPHESVSTGRGRIDLPRGISSVVSHGFQIFVASAIALVMAVVSRSLNTEERFSPVDALVVVLMASLVVYSGRFWWHSSEIRRSLDAVWRLMLEVGLKSDPEQEKILSDTLNKLKTLRTNRTLALAYFMMALSLASQTGFGRMSWPSAVALIGVSALIAAALLWTLQVAWANCRTIADLIERLNDVRLAVLSHDAKHLAEFRQDYVALISRGDRAQLWDEMHRKPPLERVRNRFASMKASRKAAPGGTSMVNTAAQPPVDPENPP